MLNRPIPATWAPGAVVPGTVYRIIRPLGSGGMGDVYEAEHELLGVRRAIKVLSRRLAERGDLAERLRVEARALAGLRHPNLVEVNDLGISSDGRLFFAMELLVGSTLRDRLHTGGRLKLDQAVSVAVQVLDALGAAHERGMIHRDVKPENIFLLQSGGVKLLDFGVAKALSAAATPQQLTAAGMAIGTPRYMAPEQAQALPLDARADIYAVGIVLWEMLIGRAPYAEYDGVAAVVAAVMRGVPAVDQQGVDDLPPAIVAALARATARDPEQRFPTAPHMAAELRLLRAPSVHPEALDDRATIRFEQQSTSLVPIVPSGMRDSQIPGDITDVDPRSGAGFEKTEMAGGETSPALSVPHDHRNRPTPTAVPIVSNVVATPETRAATPVAANQGGSRGLLFLAIPAVIVLFAGGFFLFRPAKQTPAPPLPDVVAAPEPATTPSVPSAAPAATADPAPSATPAPPPSASAAPTASSRRDGRGRPAPAPPGPTKDKPPPKAGGMPGSGL